MVLETIRRLAADRYACDEEAVVLAATFDELNKYFTISGMPIASSQYWNSIHGRAKGDANQDEEGKQIMRVLARNMTFLMKSIALGKAQFGLPETEDHLWTHFIR